MDIIQVIGQMGKRHQYVSCDARSSPFFGNAMYFSVYSQSSRNFRKPLKNIPMFCSIDYWQNLPLIVAIPQCGNPHNKPSPVSPNMGKRQISYWLSGFTKWGNLQPFRNDTLPCSSGTGCLAARGLQGGTFFVAPGTATSDFTVCHGSHGRQKWMKSLSKW